MSAEPDHTQHKGKVNLTDASGADKKEVCLERESATSAYIADISCQELDTSTAILKKKKKPNSLM